MNKKFGFYFNLILDKELAKVEETIERMESGALTYVGDGAEEKNKSQIAYFKEYFNELEQMRFADPVEPAQGDVHLTLNLSRCPLLETSSEHPKKKAEDSLNNGRWTTADFVKDLVAEEGVAKKAKKSMAALAEEIAKEIKEDT